MVRGILDAFLAGPRRDGLVMNPEGWTFTDWVPSWTRGVPYDRNRGCLAVTNWLLLRALDQAAELETVLGDPLQAARWSARAGELHRALERTWDGHRGRYRDLPDPGDPDHASELVAALALLVGREAPGRRDRLLHGLLADPTLVPATVYGRHEVFAALAAHGHARAILDRLEPWYGSLAAGLVTVPEEPQPSRSDCHGWSAHPRFHVVVGLAGLRPADAGGRRFLLDPDPGALADLEVALPVGVGVAITVRLGTEEGGGRTCRIQVPDGCTVVCGAVLGGAVLGPGTHAPAWRSAG